MMPSAMVSQRTMPPKMLTRMALTLEEDRISLKARDTRSAVAPPPTSRKLAGSPPCSLHHVHGRHRQAGAVDHAADVAVQRHVVQADFVGDVLALVFLTGIAQLGGILVPVQGVVVQTDLGVQRHHLAVGSRSAG
jgi:hypothetical protein